jgi:hypothetical protein
MERPEQNRPRSKSTFSFKSDKSHKSQEKHAEYGHQRQASHDKHGAEHFAVETKANPNRAMEENQPIATALEKPTLQSLRSFQHTDTNGNPIVDPDLSNPTRSRWERPLDTIRSFEAAIDGEYRRRAQTMRNDASTEVGYASRRSSYYGGPANDQNRYSQAGGGYYGSRQAAAARESWGGESGYGPMGAPRTRYNRMQSDPTNSWNNRYSNGQNVYPQQGYQQSRDTVNTGGSNGSHSEQYSNEPSSENSSIERGGPVMRPDMGEQYGFSGFGGGPQPILEEYGNGAGPSQNGYMPQQRVGTNGPPVPTKAGPPVPTHNPNMIKLTSSQGQGPPPANKPNVLSRKNTDGSEKRKSWLKRRFSKN